MRQQVPAAAAAAHHQDLEPGCPSEPGGLLNVMVGPWTVMVALWERQEHIEIFLQQPGVDLIQQAVVIRMYGAFLSSDDHRRVGHDRGAARVAECQFWRGGQRSGNWMEWVTYCRSSIINAI